MRKSLLCFVALLPLPPRGPDELRLVDGRVLVGTVQEKGDVLVVTTRDGVLQIARSDVERRRTTEELRAELKQLAQKAPRTPFSHLQLATQAHGWGLEPELWQFLDLAVTVPRDPAHQSQRSRVDDFLARLEPELLPRKFRTADTPTRVHELLARLTPDAGAGRRAAITELLAREPNADKDLRTEARRNDGPARRVLAVEALLRRPTTGNDRFAWRTTILDREAGVREAAAVLSRDAGAGDEAVRYLAPGLMHDNAEVRVRTAEAFANLDAKAAIKPLVVAGPAAGKALAAADEGVRAHVAFLQQQAYIRDFDVEVAQASFIADPKIAVLQSGAVLDVTVAGVYEEVRILTAYRAALRRLAGGDPGPRPKEWATWLANQPQLLPPAAATAPTTSPTAAGTPGTQVPAPAPATPPKRR